MNETQLQQWLKHFEKPFNPDDTTNLSSEDLVTLIEENEYR